MLCQQSQATVSPDLWQSYALSPLSTLKLHLSFKLKLMLLPTLYIISHSPQPHHFLAVFDVRVSAHQLQTWPSAIDGRAVVGAKRLLLQLVGRW